MDESKSPGKTKRRKFLWPQSATELVERLLTSEPSKLARSDVALKLATKLGVLTGNPRDACLRWIRKQGIPQKRTYRSWSTVEEQKLVDLIEHQTVDEIAIILRRTPNAVRMRLHHLGETSQRGREWFTVHNLSEALHVRVEEVRRWIAKGWLQSRHVTFARIQKEIIEADDFAEFVKKHGRSVIGRRLSIEGLAFVQNFVFPPKHAHLLPLRGPRDQEQLPIDEAQGNDDEEGNDLDESA